MAIICMFFPAVLWVYMRLKLSKSLDNNEVTVFQLILSYVIGVILINIIIIGVRRILIGGGGNIYDLLNQYDDFALKYLFLSLLLSVLIPVAEIYFRNSWSVKIDFNINELNDWFARIRLSFAKIRVPLLLIYAILLASINVLRLFNNSFWGDEGLAIIAANKGGINDVLSFVADNGHTPLHYIIMYYGCKLLGYSGFSYHFLSTLPYFILMVIGITWVRKCFSIHASLILITLMTLLDHTITYNLEVRMYAWCQVFIFLTFIMAYQLYYNAKNIYFFLMMLFSLLAIYSHYYALASIGVIYLFLFCYYIKQNEKNAIIKIFLSGLIDIVLFLPWLVFCAGRKGVMLNYGIELVKVNDCVDFIFSSKYTDELLIIFFISFSLWLLYLLKIFELNKVPYGDGISEFKVNFTAKGKFNKDIIWALSGVCAVFGTIFMSELISYVAYPIVVLRYLYPSFILIWLILAVSVSKLYFKKIWTVLLILLVFMSGGQKYIDKFQSERLNDQILETTLKETAEIGSDSFILTDITHLNWTVSQVYFPLTQHALIDIDDIPEIDRKYDNWLFLKEPITKKVEYKIENQGFNVELMVDEGFIGTGKVWIYKLVDEL